MEFEKDQIHQDTIQSEISNDEKNNFQNEKQEYLDTLESSFAINEFNQNQRFNEDNKIEQSYENNQNGYEIQNDIEEPKEENSDKKENDDIQNQKTKRQKNIDKTPIRAPTKRICKQPKKDIEHEIIKAKPQKKSLTQIRTLKTLQKHHPYIFDQNNKIIYPIDDTLLQTYECLFKQKDYFKSNIIRDIYLKPQLIDPQDLGDILLIWNFFENFSNILDEAPEFSKEELYVCLKYKDTLNVKLINDIHMSLIQIILQEIRKSGFIDQYPFMQMYKELNQQETLKEQLIAIWPELLKQILLLPKTLYIFQNYNPQLINILSQSYNQIVYQDKIMILKYLIDKMQLLDILNANIDERIIYSESQHHKLTQKYQLLNKKSKQPLIIKQEIQLKKELFQNKFYVNSAYLLGQDIQKNQYWVNLLFSIKFIIIFQYKSISNWNFFQLLNYLKLSYYSPLQVRFYHHQKIFYSIHYLMHHHINIYVKSLFVYFNQIYFIKNQKYFYHLNNTIYVYHPNGEQWSQINSSEDLSYLLKQLNPKGIRESNLDKELRNFLQNDYFQFDSSQNKINYEDVVKEVFNYKNEKTPIVSKQITTRRSESYVEKEINVLENFLEISYPYISQIIISLEQAFTKYLNTINAHWISKQNISFFTEDVKNIQSNDEFKTILFKINQQFEYVYQNDKSEDEQDQERSKIQINFWSVMQKDKMRTNFDSYILNIFSIQGCFFSIIFFDFLIRKYLSKQYDIQKQNYYKEKQKQEKQEEIELDDFIFQRKSYRQQL